MSYTTRIDITLGDHSDPSQQKLFLQVLDEGLRILAVNESKQPVLYRLIEYEKDAVEQDSGLQTWLQEQADWLQLWGALVVVHHCQQAAVVPESLFGNDNGKELLDCLFGDLFRGTMLTEKIPDREDYSLYRISTARYLGLAAAHHSVKQYHLFTAWLPGLEQLPAGPDGDVYLLFENKKVAMAVRNNGWQMISQYEYQVPEDISYILLSALQQAGLSPETVSVHLDGWIERDSALFLELFKYIRNLEIAVLPESVQLDESLLQGQPVHFFNPLIQMSQCVS
ncbi:DUF3822 family protein [Flavihumibacter stibioxidans]|uniref:DUF3822 family protein n=1 Tax=Flavihumibacter stibioxidans TaxID=1834163 RepID=A0ABR7M418_9BACT|nr:DUF3822 family protein [Flavihumibacter stibioxidans]MBC6489727.1 hypothetical protein [Flavihumibacter stibioxidans]